MAKVLSSILLAVLVACGPIPTDPHETLEQIRASEVLRLGHVEGVAIAPARDALARLTERTGARSSVRKDAGEPLLWALTRGELDLVLGRFASASPWGRSLWLSPPLSGGSPGAEEPVLRFAARQGENGWIMLLSETLEAP